VSDGALTASRSYSVHVNEVNLAPEITGVPGAVTIPELVLYTFNADATDADDPVQVLTFSLVGAPAGASIDPSTGVFTWTPTEVQGPNVYSFAVRVSDGVANTDAPITITVDEVSIAAITDLAASIVRSGNDGDGTTQVLLTWTAAPIGTTVEVYRARYGQYPEYDDLGGDDPDAPTYPPASPWEPTGVTAPGQTDEVNNGPSGYAGRDYWYYVAFVRGEGANVSDPSNIPATPNYLLGDVSDGTAPGLGRGNNVVDGADVSILGDSYGFTGAAVTPVAYLDVGPTTDFSVNGRSLTDNAINFEDLVMFAINYGTGPGPQQVARAETFSAQSEVDRLTVSAPLRVAAGEEFTARLRLEGSGRVQALSAALTWADGVVEPVAVEAGEWLQQLGGVALTPEPGVADVALLGLEGGGMQGEGEIAVVRFRAVAAGEPQVTLAEVKARDAVNHEVEVATAVLGTPAPLPTVTQLSPAFPNPFRGSTTIAFSLMEAGPVRVTVFGVDGRKVRTLTNGLWEAGFHRLAWDGRGDDGRTMSAGIYFVQLTTNQGRFTKRITGLR
jgi:hypothetical protein